MLKLTKNHTIFEVYNDWGAESVYIDHRPTWDELVWLVKANDWLPGTNLDIDQFIKKYIFVEKERHLYTMTEKAKRDKYQRERGED